MYTLDLNTWWYIVFQIQTIGIGIKKQIVYFFRPDRPFYSCKWRPADVSWEWCHVYHRNIPQSGLQRQPWNLPSLVSGKHQQMLRWHNCLILHQTEKSRRNITGSCHHYFRWPFLLLRGVLSSAKVWRPVWVRSFKTRQSLETKVQTASQSLDQHLCFMEWQRRTETLRRRVSDEEGRPRKEGIWGRQFWPIFRDCHRARSRRITHQQHKLVWYW